MPHSAHGRPGLGVDFGGVIVERSDDTSDGSFFGTRPLDTPEMPGAIDTIAALASGRFLGRVFVVSKASPRIEALTRQWMRHVDFHRRTGIFDANIVFVRDRLAKGEVCRKYGLTHFVDDRLDVLESMPFVPQRYLFASVHAPQVTPTMIQSVASWAVLRDLLEK